MMKIPFLNVERGCARGWQGGAIFNFLSKRRQRKGDGRGVWRGGQSLWRDLQGNAPLTESKQAQGEISTH